MKKMPWILKYCTLSCMVLLISGCASLKTTYLEAYKPAPPGLVYHLPTQKLQLTLTVTKAEIDNEKKEEQAGDDKRSNGDKNKEDKLSASNRHAVSNKSKLIRVITLEKTEPVADLSARYVVEYRRNHAGTNLLEVRIGENGLLTGESLGKTTPQISDLIKGAALNFGTTAVTALRNDCGKIGIYRWTFDPYNIPNNLEPEWTDCGIDVSLVLPSCGNSPNCKSTQSTTNENTKYKAGYFYRQGLPLQVTVSDKITQIRSIYYPTLVSSQSPTYFLPIPKTVFAPVEWKVAFNNGIPTLYKIESGGDVLGMIKLPGEIVQAYSDALLSGIHRKTTAAKDEAAYLDELNKLAQSEAKRTACQAAVATGDLEVIKATCQ